MSHKTKTSLDKLAEKWAMDTPSKRARPAAKAETELSRKYNSIRRQNVQGEQCFPCFECITLINGRDSAYYEGWERIVVPPEDSGQQLCPVLRKLCRECGLKYQTPENTR
jgi:hypothetical protein